MDTIVKTEGENHGYFFQVNARTGAPGFADYNCYISRRYITFSEAYRELVGFSPQKQWHTLRNVQHVWIWKEGIEKLGICFYDNLACTIDIEDLPKLGVCEEDFYILIESIEQQLSER